MHYIKKIAVDEKVELAYQFVGNKCNDRPLLVFLHEGLGSIGQWKKFPALLCEALDLQGLVYDRYGYGQSTALQEKRESEYLEYEGKYFLPLLVEKLGLQERELILFGHSDGGSIALVYAALFPDNILAVISMAHHVFLEQISVDSITKLRALYDSDPRLKKSFSKYHGDKADSVVYAFSDTILGQDFKQWRMDSYLQNIKAPIFTLQGDHDEYGTEKQMDLVIKNSPNKHNKKMLIPNCKHSPHLEYPELIVKEVKAFLKMVLPNYFS